MVSPIAVQLYSVRESLAHDLTGVIERIAEMGYVGVEPWGLSGDKAQESARLFQSLGLQVSSVHSDLPLGDRKSAVLDAAAALGCQRLVLAFIPPDQMKTADQVKAVCDRLNEADTVARAAGLTLAYHNHWWEFQPIEGGRTPHALMVEHLNPTVQFELDTYWIKTGGQDPAAVVKQLGKRAPLLHIKDGSTNKDDPMVAVGDGSMDVPAIVKAGEGATAWLIVELDRCATDMLEAVAKSYRYLVGKGLARGNKN